MREAAYSTRTGRDYQRIIRTSRLKFGELQSLKYALLLELAEERLLEDPFDSASRARDEIVPGLRSFHIRNAKRYARASHFIFYMAPDDETLWIVRYLHDRTDPPQRILKKDLHPSFSGRIRQP